MTELVSLNNVGKSYPKVHRHRDRLIGLRATLRGRRELPSATVLSDINLSVQAGESLAIIGENGAGKSTLLKLIAGVLHPTQGTVHVQGKIGALLELGAGFHPDYSGRRNVLMTAALMGFSRDQAIQLLPRVAEFADLADKLDQPIKHYSSGMVVRLGFALIAHTRPDLLISDEVLAVGDELFQRKCIAWLEQYLADGGTLLLVSHGLYHIQKLCQRACWIDAGKVREYGDVYAVTQAYLAHHEAKLARVGGTQISQTIQLQKLEVNQLQTSDRLSIAGDQLLQLRFEQTGGDVANVSTDQASLGQTTGRAVAEIAVSRADGVVLASGQAPLRPGSNAIEFALPGLLPAQYCLTVTAVDAAGERLSDPLRRMFQINGRSREFGSIALSHQWGGA